VPLFLVRVGLVLAVGVTAQVIISRAEAEAVLVASLLLQPLTQVHIMAQVA
jgi:hypothetical protein